MEVKEKAGIFFLYLGLQVMLCGCMALPKATKSPPHTLPGEDAGISSRTPETLQVQPDNQIIFVSLVILQDTSLAGRVIRVESMVKKPGLLKTQRSVTFTAKPYLKGTLLSGPQPLDTFLLEHPLFKNQEYVNEQNQLVWKTLSLDQASFFIRFQQKGASHLKIEEKLPDSPAKELMRIKL